MKRWYRAYLKEKRKVDAKRLSFPELESVQDLPLLLSGDRLPPAGDPVSYYTPDGDPMEDDLYDTMQKIYGDYKKRPENNLGRVFYRRGVRIVVSTSYIGHDLNLGGRVPLFWETMVFVGGLTEIYCARYASRAAAYNGHVLVSTAIMNGQRARRDAPKVRPVSTRRKLAGV